MTTTTIIGTSGATILLIAFVLNQLNKWQNEDFIYDFFNLVGGALMITYAYLLKSWPFFALNLVWSAVSAKDVIVFLIKKGPRS